MANKDFLFKKAKKEREQFQNNNLKTNHAKKKN